MDILERIKGKKPKLDLEKAVNRAINEPGSSAGGKVKGADKKSKTQLKKTVGKKKAGRSGKKGSKNVTGKKSQRSAGGAGKMGSARGGGGGSKMRGGKR